MRRSKQRAWLCRNPHSDGKVYWTVRSCDRGLVRYGKRVRPAHPVLVNLGRVPRDPLKLKAFLLRARLALLRYGIVEPIKKGIRAVRPLPESIMRRRNAIDLPATGRTIAH